MAHDIFISYSTKDKPTADAACATLEAAGIRCWIAPRDILPGMEWGEAIIRAINDCRAMVLVFSSNANDSTQIRREVERAVSKGVPVIPLRIEDIAPTHSLEYFIGTVHWLDALTPPLESHLHRLSDNVAALLNTGINPHKSGDAHAPSPMPPPAARPLPPSPPPHPSVVHIPSWTLMAVAAIVVVVVGALWWHSGHDSNSSVPASSFGAGTPSAASPNVYQTPSQGQAPLVDPGVVGTLEYSSVVDDTDWHFTDQVNADGTFSLVAIQQESGTFQAANGQYQSVGAKTHRVRQGTYVALSADTMQVTNSAGTVVYRLQQPGSQGSGPGQFTLGTWQGTIVVNGQPWALTLQVHADGTYLYTARNDDHGTCRIANGVWQSTSAVTGQSTPGTYQVLNAHQVRLTSASGTGVWQRS